MKEIRNHKKNIFLKKIFIKICRFFGYEIIDQNTFEIPTLNKALNEDISAQGVKSINLPLGEIKITRKVRSLDIIVRTCTEVNMLTQNKKRIFEKDKIEYTLRTINSIIRSINSSIQLKNLKIGFKIIDHGSNNENLGKMHDLFKEKNFKFDLMSLDILKYGKNIKNKNQKNETVTKNQISNMANIHQSLVESKKCEDLVYFVEDDYIHAENAMEEMVLTYERIASQINKELIICPADYPYLYTKADSTQIFLGNRYHWRKVSETLCTFLTSTKIINQYWDVYKSMCELEHYPFEKPLHDIYEKEICLSPIPSLAMHCTNINSIFGLSPNIDWKKLWDENK